MAGGGPEPERQPADGSGEGSAALGLASAYRRFALANPGAYALLFDHSLPALDVDESLRSDTVARVVSLFANADEEAVATGSALEVWATMHGLIALERSMPWSTAGLPSGDWKSFYLRTLGATPALQGESR